mgnify:CR=1 FL=1
MCPPLIAAIPAVLASVSAAASAAGAAAAAAASAAVAAAGTAAASVGAAAAGITAGQLAAASLVVSLAGAGMSMYGQQVNKSAQEDYQQRLADANQKQMFQNRDLATRAYLDQANASNTRLSETREAVAAKNFDQSRKSMEAKGTAIASAAEAGVYGVSLTGLLKDFDRQEAMFSHRNEMNLINTQQQTVRANRGYHQEAEARSMSIQPYQPSPVAPVDYAGPLLSVAQTGIQAYGIYSRDRKTT